MNKKSITWLSLALIFVLMASSILTGCTPADAPSQPTGNSPQQSATSDSGSGSVSGAQRVFKIWHWEPEGYAMDTAWAAAMAEFQRRHPDVKIEFERKTFEGMQQSAQMVLNSNDVPDVMELNKGNATAGLFSKQGLLTDLTEVAEQRGWTDVLPPSVMTTSRYDENGVMGNGRIYGVTNYGEFVMVYYNKDLFKQYGVEVPTTLEEFEAVSQTFVDAGVTPLTMGALDMWPPTHNWQELMLYGADRETISNFQFLEGDLTFQEEAFTFGTDKFIEHLQRGFYPANANGMAYDDANSAFFRGQVPMNLTGSWAFGDFLNNAKEFEWGIFLMPGKQFNTGSGGQLWVVPTNAKNKDLAYDFIDITLSVENQTILANAGGIPVNADITKIEDPKTRELNELFALIVANDGLAFYPDWPVPGYMDTLGEALQSLIAGAMTREQFLDFIAKPYLDYKATLK